jgi:hypothetical protein
MPHLFRTLDGKLWKASHPLDLAHADGTKAEAVWGGSAQEEKLTWWLAKPGHQLAQTQEVAAVAVRDDETDQINWGDAPPGARLFFVLEPPVKAKDGTSYRIAKMVTNAVTPAQLAYFRETRFALFGTLHPDGSLSRIPPLPPPPPQPPLQGELF